MDPNSSREEEQRIMDAESSKSFKKNRRLRNICIAIAVIIIVIILVIVILAFTVFKAKNPVITVDSIGLADLKVPNIGNIRTAGINLTLDLDVTVENPNKVGMNYKETSTLLYYRGGEVGEVPIPAGKISSDETVAMNLTLTWMADRFLSNSQSIPDLTSGQLPLSTYTKISGKVKIFNMFKIHVDATATCNFTVFISNSTVSDKQCTTKKSL